MKISNAIKLALPLAIAGAFVSVSAEERVLNVTNWAEYMAEDTISNFEEETGIKVTFDPYDSVETIDSKLLAGSTGYDVVSHSGSAIARFVTLRTRSSALTETNAPAIARGNASFMAFEIFIKNSS